MRLFDGLRKVRNAVLKMIGRPTTEGASDGPTSSFAPNSAARLKHDPRRYKRALLLSGTGGWGGAGGGIQQEIASASAIFRGRSFSVVDLSHTGVAIERVDIQDADLPDGAKPESMVLHCGLLEPFSVQVALARHSSTVLAFEYIDVSTEGRLTIDRFLNPKMIGLNMRAVDRAFFSPGETFTLWFCGPRDTNFFLWMNEARLERAILQLGDEQFTVAPGATSGTGGGSSVRFVQHNAPLPGASTSEAHLRDSILFALDVALQVKNGGPENTLAIASLVKLLTEAADTLQPRS